VAIRFVGFAGDLDEKLLPNRAKQPLNLAPALWLSG
jgi:hypothetical protein